MFTPGTEGANAVGIIAHQQVGLFFAGALTTNHVDPTMQAIAGQANRDFAIVLDRSGTMAATKEDGRSTGWKSGGHAPHDSLWHKAVESTLDFLNTLEGTAVSEQVCLVTYSDTAVVDVSLSLDYSSIAPILNDYTDEYFDGATNISDGIEMARQSLIESGLGRSRATPMIVVITDGSNNAGTTTPSEAATEAAADGIIIHTITYGDDANQAEMINVASIGHGEHWHAPRRGELTDAFDDIAGDSPTLLIQ